MSVFHCELQQTAVNRRIVARFENRKVRANRLEDDSAASLIIDDNGTITHSQPAAAMVPQETFVAVGNIMPIHLNTVAAFVSSFLDRQFDV
ncbi:MAG TPA: hypothetical protein VG055_32755 [Planctomycetaceae bacterium]|jgi:hypothetical protein|nr:hypothetical protein [Planctomycetaceae bacterium]